jgi:hypothetical protein
MKAGYKGHGRRFAIIAAALGCISAGCGDRCLAFDYSPPSAELSLRDAATGQPMCSSSDFFITTSSGTLIPHEDTCEWWLPEWISAADAPDASESQVTLSVNGYTPRILIFEVTRNECGEIQRPAFQEVLLTRE